MFAVVESEIVAALTELASCASDGLVAGIEVVIHFARGFFAGTTGRVWGCSGNVQTLKFSEPLRNSSREVSRTIPLKSFGPVAPV